MFNFNLMNRALKDAELKDAFRMLYYIVNKCSLKNSMSVEIFDAEFELALSISPRSTCRFTKKLEERGYIKKEVRGTSQNKLANIYTLINIDTTDDKNAPLTDDANIDGSSDGSSDGRIGILKNNIKINKKNIHVNNIKPEVIKPEVNNKTYINSDINKNKFMNSNINTDNSDEVFLSNFMKVDNINTGNSDDQTKDLRIEENINLNNENEMNEERVNEMNNIINSNETYMNTPTLEEMLETQALDDNQAFNNFSSFQNKEINYSKPEQERYQRLFNTCKSQIEMWMKTHDYSCISMFDSYFEAIQDMKDNNLISVKQWNAAQRYLFQRFQNLRNGYFNYIQKKKENISSNEISECNNPQPPRQQNDQMKDAV